MKITKRNRNELDATGQTRARWDTTPIDLFFNSHSFSEVVASRVRRVPFSGSTIPISDCTSLAVFKAFFHRTKDWADLEAMAEAGQLDTIAVGAFLRDLHGGDQQIERLMELVDVHPYEVDLHHEFEYQK